jgi:PhzF family phenazine biosynthesis protein
VRIPLWQVDAFAERAFGGNPAAVCRLERWLPDAVLQAIAAENALSETAFFTGPDDGWRLRWFTPVNEVDLCGHATLATAWVVLHRLSPGRESVTFQTQSGALKVERRGELLEMDFPAWIPKPCDPPPPELAAALGTRPLRAFRTRDWLCVLPDEASVRAISPDLAKLVALPEKRAVMVTAAADPGRGVDFVSRFFAPAEGVPEDPVTGSAHCTLVPYWSERLGKNELVAEQVSARGGRLWCRSDGPRVRIAGRCAPFLTGEIELEG